MRIDIVKWQSDGLRCPDVEIDLRVKGQVAQVSLIQMPNGTGKTTTLNLLTAALNGTATAWSQDKVRSFRRVGDPRPKGKFVVELAIDGKPLTFELSLDFDEGAASYRTTALGSGGIQNGWRPPPAVHRFLTEQFIDLFVFDGEFADRLLDSASSEAERAIDALCQLYLFDEVRQFADEDWKRASAKKKNPGTAAALARYERERNAAIQQRLKLSDAKEKATSEAATLRVRVGELKELIAAHVGKVDDLKASYAEAQADLIQADGEVQLGSSQLMQRLRQPYALHEAVGTRLLALKDNLDRLRLPETTTRQFFAELVQEPECICGRPLDEACRAEIHSRAAQYLDADESGLVNSLKSQIESLVQGTSAVEEAAAEQAKLAKSVKSRRQAETRTKAIQDQLIERGDQQLKDWQDELELKAVQLEKLDRLIERINASDDPEEDLAKIMSLSVLKRRVDEADAQIAAISDTVRLHQVTKALMHICTQAKEVARNRVKAALLEETNDRLATVLSNDPVKIDRIERSIHLAHQTGASVGQTLSVGYTFLMSALSRGQNLFPLVVDSPAGPLDIGRREEIGKLIPDLCSQFVGFTISVERLGFVTALEAAGATVKYVTLFRKTPGTEPLMATLPKHARQTANAVLVEDKEYFHRFDLVKEVG